MWLYADINNVADIVRHYARVTPFKTALLEGEFSLNYADLNSVTSAIANKLKHRGVKEGDVVAFLGKNSIPFFEVLYGGAKAGATVLPLNWRLAPPELAAIMDDSQPKIIFVEEELIPLLDQVRQIAQNFTPQVVIQPAHNVHGNLDTFFSDASSDDPGLPSTPVSIAWLMYTSGTTGQAKGVEISHQALNFMRLSEHFEPVFQWRADDVLMMVMPNFHLLGTALPIQAMYNGCTVSIMPVLEPGKMLKLIGKTKPSILVLAPTVIQMMLDHPEASQADTSSLRLIMYAGSAINAQLLKRALKEISCDYMQFYGATESCGAMSVLRPEQHDLIDESKLKSCGTPLPLIDFQIVNDEGQPVPDGEIGEIKMRSPAIFSGYRNQPEQTALVLYRGWYKTGDAGYRDPKDGLYYIVDRVKDMIVTGGENVYSAEVEQAIQKHPDVAMSAVIALPDERWGERVTAVVVTNPGKEIKQDELIAHCRTLIAGYKLPKQVIFEPSLPISPSGKILKRVLREKFGIKA